MRSQTSLSPVPLESPPRSASEPPRPASTRRRAATVECRLSEVPRIPCRVLLASDDTESVATLRSRFDGRLAMEHIRHIGELMDIVPATRNERVVLVLDCTSPTMHPASVAGLSDELPYGWWVVAWGIDALTWDELEPDRQGPLHWVRCGDDAHWEDVMGLTHTLLAAAR